MPITAVFWDSDNTLVDTAAHHWNKHFYVLKKAGITLDDQWQNKIYTNNGQQNWEWLSRDLGLKLSCEDYLNQIDQWYFDHIESIELRSGILQSLEFLKNQNIPMLVVSNGRRRSVMAALTAKKITPYFLDVLCIEDYQGRKPSPAPYLAAKTRLQQKLGHSIAPETCLVIEDDPKGVESGKAAGMHFFHRPIGTMAGDEFYEKIQRWIYDPTPPL
jgi:HAD superfamily hydrolase (TIGR01509 family)